MKNNLFKKINYIIYSMLSDTEITLVEGLFLVIDSKELSHDCNVEIYEFVRTFNEEAFIYLDWLLLRWTRLRNNVSHLPNRINRNST